MGFWLSLIGYTICTLLAILAYIIWCGPPESPPGPDRRVPYPPELAKIPPGFDYRSTWYTDIYEKAYGSLHRDGQHVIFLMDPESGWSGDEITNVREKHNWATIKMVLVYERMNGDEHPRIVRYAGQLEGRHLVLERLSPGPLKEIGLPEYVDQPTRALYYSWSLQALSALSFLHAHGITTKGFGEQNVWMRSDFSIALTAFTNAFIDGKEAPDFNNYENGCWAGEEDWSYHDECSENVEQDDLYYWGRWVFFLLAPNADEEIGSPSPFYERYETFETWKATQEALRNEMLEHLGEDPIGPILWKTWKGEYSTLEDVVKDVKECALQIGLQVVGEDEIDFGKPWKDVFEIVWGGGRYRNFVLRLKK